MGQDVLKSIISKSGAEFYSPFPEAYKIGKIKYIIVAGSVMSGVGKGIFSSSLAKLLQYANLRVSPIKIDGYFNQDAGTLNPFRHGEVFVLDDGMECDMDLGSYERFLNQSLSKENYLTSGMVFANVLNRERKGGYLGRDVQFIPHVTGEVKFALRNLAMKSKADIVLVEIGGTVGDYENSYIIEAMRELIYEEGRDNVCFITLCYIVNPPSLGEQKSKPAQLGLNRLMAFGIQPRMVVCRATNPVSEKIREKISVYSNVGVDYVIGLHNSDSVYEVPLQLKQFNVDDRVLELLKIQKKDKWGQRKKLNTWNSFIKKRKNSKRILKIGIAGKYTGLNDSYASILKALEHAGTHNDSKIEIKYIETTKIEKGKNTVEEELGDIDALVIPGGFGKRGAEGKIECIKYARENGLPFLGLCYGLQMAVVEYARNVCGIKYANSIETEPDCKNPVIGILEEQKNIESLGGNMRLGAYPALLKKGSLIYKLYGSEKIFERHRHRFEVNPDYIDVLQENGLLFSGVSPNRKLMEFLELPGHPYFVATQAHPEFKSRPLKPSPMFDGLIKTVIKRKQ